MRFPDEGNDLLAETDLGTLISREILEERCPEFDVSNNSCFMRLTSVVTRRRARDDFVWVLRFHGRARDAGRIRVVLCLRYHSFSRRIILVRLIEHVRHSEGKCG